MKISRVGQTNRCYIIVPFGANDYRRPSSVPNVLQLRTRLTKDPNVEIILIVGSVSPLQRISVASSARDEYYKNGNISCNGSQYLWVAGSCAERQHRS